jgi:hypothetical protein
MHSLVFEGGEIVAGQCKGRSSGKVRLKVKHDC